MSELSNNSGNENVNNSSDQSKTHLKSTFQNGLN